MYVWPHDNQAELIAFYGRPGPAVESQLVRVVPPFQMYYDGKRIKHLLFHKKAAGAFAEALQRVWVACGQDQARIDALGISKTAGTYNHRKVRNSENWSSHAFGMAGDFNAEENGFGKGRGTIPAVLIAAFDAVGFRWGGRYKGRTDPMHFEAIYSGIPQVASFIGGAVASDFDAYEGEAHCNGCVLHDDEQGEGGQDDDAPRPSLWRRIRNWGGGGATGAGGFGVLGALTDWQTAIVCFVALFLAVAAIVAFVIYFFGADNVRAWVRGKVG